MKKIITLLFIAFIFSSHASAGYERNKAVPVQEVLFGKVQTVRNITEQELIRDRNKGWKVFGGALVGGAIGSQFGDGSGQVAATILGSIIGASISDKKHPQYREKTLRLVEMMIKTDQGKSYMVVQDFDSRMIFNRDDKIRLIYLANGSVRIDKAF
jgi:outer membrane lipoprotein SlyB